MKERRERLDEAEREEKCGRVLLELRVGKKGTGRKRIMTLKERVERGNAGNL